MKCFNLKNRILSNDLEIGNLYNIEFYSFAPNLKRFRKKQKKLIQIFNENVKKIAYSYDYSILSKIKIEYPEENYPETIRIYPDNMGIFLGNLIKKQDSKERKLSLFFSSNLNCIFSVYTEGEYSFCFLEKNTIIIVNANDYSTLHV